MKKYIVPVLLLVSALSLQAWAAHDYRRGDVNLDGEVDRKDRIYLARALAGWDGYSLDWPDEEPEPARPGEYEPEPAGPDDNYGPPTPTPRPTEQVSDSPYNHIDERTPLPDGITVEMQTGDILYLIFTNNSGEDMYITTTVEIFGASRDEFTLAGDSMGYFLRSGAKYIVPLDAPFVVVDYRITMEDVGVKKNVLDMNSVLSVTSHNNGSAVNVDCSNSSPDKMIYAGGTVWFTKGGKIVSYDTFSLHIWPNGSDTYTAEPASYKITYDDYFVTCDVSGWDDYPATDGAAEEEPAAEPVEEQTAASEEP